MTTRMGRATLWLVALLLLFSGVVQAQQLTDFNTFLLNTRADVERLADEVLGAGNRPQTWTFNINDTSSQTYLSDLWFDNEQLAAQIFGADRPPGWIGAPVTQDPVVVARNIRHDLEISAEQVFGPGNRPPDWRGGPALFRCDRAIMNAVRLLQTAYGVQFTTAENTPNYCLAIAAEVERQSVDAVLNDPALLERVPEQVLAVRGDLERLADEELGLNARPPGWIGNRSLQSETLISDTFLDLESLANDQIGAGQRPPGWLNNLPRVPLLDQRYLRFNLELLANALGRIPRPRGWQSSSPLENCLPSLQALVDVARDAYSFDPNTVSTEGNVCASIDLGVNSLIENPPVEVTQQTVDDRLVFESDIAFAYLDVSATQYMGQMPRGTRFKAWYRNFRDSTMMFVSGDDFAVFIDRRWTTMPQEVYITLPTLEGVKPLTFCDASWCDGPGPTPTPTGFGALELLLNAGTPPAAPDVEQVSGEKRQVSWNYIRVTYLLDNAQARTAQVTLEICADTAQTDCEPVLSIFDNNIGAAKPVLSQLNGLNVYEFPYGYTANLLIEGSTLFSPDVWISDPTIR